MSKAIPQGRLLGIPVNGFWGKRGQAYGDIFRAALVGGAVAYPFPSAGDQRLAGVGGPTPSCGSPTFDHADWRGGRSDSSQLQTSLLEKLFVLCFRALFSSKEDQHRQVKFLCQRGLIPFWDNHLHDKDTSMWGWSTRS